MSNDKEYDEMMKADRKAKRLLKQAHYRIDHGPRCWNCKNLIAGSSSEDQDECGRVNPERKYSIGWVDINGICDFWERSRP
ncbi:MAG: hypothetical protein PHX80_03640 [Candidatus Nanoarchaeia archaeon]|nr:hypothetical protein [Candidatus Nanoarchaeia archaeon]